MSSSSASLWVSIDSIDIQQELGQEMCIGLGMLGYIVHTHHWTKEGRTPTAGLTSFGPGRSNRGTSNNQRNFLVDKKQFLSQQATRLWEDRLWVLLKPFRMVYKRKVALKDSHNAMLQSTIGMILGEMDVATSSNYLKFFWTNYATQHAVCNVTLNLLCRRSHS